MLVEEYLRERGLPTGSVTEQPTILAQDDAEVNVDTEVSNSSTDISLDQSNNGISLVNMLFDGIVLRPCRRVGLLLHRRLLLHQRMTPASDEV